MVCRKCGNSVSSDETTCPNCGADLKPSTGSLEDKSEGLRKMSRELKAIDAGNQGLTAGDTVADRFEIEEYVGEGPFGEVYRAHDEIIDAHVALKVFDEDVIRTPPERQTFLRATEAAREMSQENVVRIHESGVADERPWVSMQYLEGLTLEKVLELRENKNERFTIQELEPIVGQITLALQHVGREYPVCTLEPDNIFFLHDLLKVTDGYLWSALPGDVVADRLADSAYLAPELKERPEEGADARCDVYSLGLIIGDMLFGPGYEPGAVDPATSELAAVDELCQRATSTDPEARYPSVEALSEDFVTLVDTGQLLESEASMGISVPAAEPEEDEQWAGPDEKTEVVPRDEAPLSDDEAETNPQASTVDPAPVGDPERSEAPPAEPDPPGDPSLPEEQLVTEEYDRDESASPEFNPEVFPDQEGDEPSLPDPDFPTDEHDSVSTPASGTPASGQTPASGRETASGSAPSSAPSQPPEEAEGSEPSLTPKGETTPAPDESAPVDPPEPADSDSARTPSGSTSIVSDTEANDETEGTRSRPDTQQTAPDDRGSDDGPPTLLIAGFFVLGLVAAVAVAVPFLSGSSSDGEAIEIAKDDPEAEATSPGGPDAGGDAGSETKPDPALAEAVGAGLEGRAEALAQAHTEADERAKAQAEKEKEKGAQSGGDEATGSARSGARGGRAPEPKTDCPDGMGLVELDSGNYCIDLFEYPGRGRKPMVQATWFEAKSKCEAAGKRLCTLQEWQRACGWGTYPYGSDWDPDACNTQDKAGFARSLAEAGSFEECRSWSGAYDMTGNAHEWVKEQKIAGGGFDSGPRVASCEYTSQKAPGSSASTIGFRCCADPE